MKTKKAPAEASTKSLKQHFKDSLKCWIKETFSNLLNVLLLILSVVSLSVLIYLLILEL
jgi:hypothetical protein